jgi:hypothetical protein
MRSITTFRLLWLEDVSVNNWGNNVSNKRFKKSTLIVVSGLNMTLKVVLCTIRVFLVTSVVTGDAEGSQACIIR